MQTVSHMLLTASPAPQPGAQEEGLEVSEWLVTGDSSRQDAAEHDQPGQAGLHGRRKVEPTNVVL